MRSTVFDPFWANVIPGSFVRCDGCRWKGYSSNAEQGRGPQILQMFQIQQNSDLLPKDCKTESPVAHPRPQGKRKMLSVWMAQRFALSPARETKWKSMWDSARIFWLFVLFRVSCILHVNVLCVCRMHMQPCSVSNRRTDCFLFRVYVWVCVKCA